MTNVVTVNIGCYARPMRSGYHHGNLREALVLAAQELVSAGSLDFSLREVARRAGVSHSAPYRHFDDREALLAAVAEHGFVELECRLAATEPALSPRARAYVRFALEQPLRFRLMFAPAHAASAPVRRARRRAVALLARERDPARSELAWAAVHGIASLGADRLLEAEGGAERLLDAALAALAHSASMR